MIACILADENGARWPLSALLPRPCVPGTIFSEGFEARSLMILVRKSYMLLKIQAVSYVVRALPLFRPIRQLLELKEGGRLSHRPRSVRAKRC